MDTKADLYVYRSHHCSFWWCAIPYVDGFGRRKQKRKAFRDHHFDGKHAALQAARKWRDAQIQQSPAPAAMKPRPKGLIAVSNPNEIRDSDNPFGLIGITVVLRERPRGGNFSVTAGRGQKKCFSMRRHGGYQAFKKAVETRCRWVQAPFPKEEDLHERYWRWAERNDEILRRFGLTP